MKNVNSWYIWIKSTHYCRGGEGPTHAGGGGDLSGGARPRHVGEASDTNSDPNDFTEEK